MTVRGLDQVGVTGRIAPSPTAAAVAALALASPALLAGAVPAAARAMQLDHNRLLSGELWRWVTCHWAHWSPEHLGWDLLAFAALIVLGWMRSPRGTACTVALAAVLIPAGVWLSNPELNTYRGLSGLDSALFVHVAACGLWREWRRGRATGLVFLAALLAFVAKLGYELWAGDTLFVEAGGFVPVPAAHAAGGMCGAAVAAWSGIREARRSTTGSAAGRNRWRR